MNNLENITWLAQSTWLWNTSLDKKEYIKYKNQETWEIDKYQTLRLNEIKKILDLDFETNTLKDMKEYIMKNIVVSYTFKWWEGSIEMTVLPDIKIEDIKKKILAKSWLQEIIITNVYEFNPNQTI